MANVKDKRRVNTIPHRRPPPPEVQRKHVQRWAHYAMLGDSKRIILALNKVLQSETATAESRKIAYSMQSLANDLYFSLKKRNDQNHG
jgi:hypothetical protein